MQTLSKRMMSVVLEKTTEYRRFKQLEDATGLPSDNWKNWLYGRQRPTVDMIEAVGKTWPEYSFWMVTGISDPKNGHTASANEGFPQAVARKENTAGYFRALIEMKGVAEEASKGYAELEDWPDFEMTDANIRSFSCLAAKGNPDIHAKLGALETACNKAKMLRMAEARLEDEVLGMLYDQIDEVLDSAERLIADAPEASKLALKKIIERERSAQLIRKQLKDK